MAGVSDEVLRVLDGYRQALSFYLARFRQRVSPLSLVAVLSSLLFIFVFTNLQTSLLVGAGHDDGWFIFHAYSIVSGHWLGPYSQYTLMKGPGYPLFLAAISLFHIPVTLGHALVWCSSVWLFAFATLRIFRSVWLSIVVFELILWNFGPHAMRVIRDEIATPQALAVVAMFMLAYPATAYARRLHMVLAGLLFGWFWITREDGVILLPGLCLLLGGLLWLTYKEAKRLQSLVLLAFFLGSFAGVETLISAINFFQYHSFTVVDFKGSFEAALESLESITPNRNISHELVTEDARLKAYRVSPTFAQLQNTLESPSSPIAKWRTASCGFYPETCGEYGAWFMWALRDAVAQIGDYNDARISSQFYLAVHHEIQTACSAGKLICSQSLIPFMPHIDLGQVKLGWKPLKRLVNLITFHEAPMPARVDSTGTEDQLQLAIVLLNLPYHTRPPQLTEGTGGELSFGLALKIRNAVVHFYAKSMGPLLTLGLLATGVIIGVILLDRKLTPELFVISSAWVFAVCRICGLALVDVSAFPAVFNMYLGYAYCFACFAATASVFCAGAVVGSKIAAAKSKPREVVDNNGETQPLL